ncbi:hypothetical protein P1P92_36575, partial [Streptomyces ipomoeae]|nr:hypothetical protein [Streptomyces ipomoeae]
STVQTDDSGTDVCQDFPVAAVHDLATGRHVASIPTGHTGAVHLATAMLEGRPVVVTGSSGDAEARLWDLATGHPIGAPLTGHTEGLTVMATTTLGGRPVAVTGSYDGTVRRWDLGTQEPIGEVLAGRTRHWVEDLDVTVLDGRPVVVAIVDSGTVYVWDLATGRPAVEPFIARDAGARADVPDLWRVGSAATLPMRVSGTGYWFPAPGTDRWPAFRHYRRCRPSAVAETTKPPPTAPQTRPTPSPRASSTPCSR